MNFINVVESMWNFIFLVEGWMTGVGCRGWKMEVKTVNLNQAGKILFLKPETLNLKPES